MIKCPACHEANLDTATSCGECGSSLLTSAQTAEEELKQFGRDLIVGNEPEELAGKLQQSDPVVQKYVETLKQQNHDLQCKIIKIRKKALTVIMFILMILGIIVGIGFFLGVIGSDV